MFRLFLGGVRVQRVGAVPKEAFILASSLFPPGPLGPVRPPDSEFSSNKGAHRATATSVRASEPEGPQQGNCPTAHKIVFQNPLENVTERRNSGGVGRFPAVAQLFSDANTQLWVPEAGHPGQSGRAGSTHGPAESAALLAGAPRPPSLG